MTKEKFIHDSETVLKFIQYYCDHKHQENVKTDGDFQLIYRNENLKKGLTFSLCEECKHSLLYSYDKLQTCPQDEKPSCRKCPEPCYEKKEWKQSAKIMKYSGMKLGLTKIKKFFKGHLQ